MIPLDPIRVISKAMSLVLAFVVMTSVVPLQARGANDCLSPVLTIGRLSSSVKVDGKLDDVCWKDAVLMQGFTCLGQKNYPTDRTRVRVAYDASYLYMAIECQQRVLDPAYQRLNEFVNRVTERDARVHCDDSVEVFLSPDRQKYYHFIFNAAGSKYDAVGRDKSWNGTWDVVCDVADGKWTAELRIPLGEVSLKPAVGREFYFNVGRNQIANSETSSWAPGSSSFHNRNEFAKGVFGIGGIGLRSDSFIECISERNPVSDLELSVIPKSASRREVHVTFFPSNDKTAVRRLSKEAADRVAFPLALSKTGEYQLQYSVTGNGSKTWFRSPLYTIGQKNTIAAEVKLKSGVLSSVKINGVQQNGKGAMVLKTGLNDIVLECILPDQMEGRIEGYLKLQSASGGPELKIPVNDQWRKNVLSAKENKVLLSRTVAANTSFFHPVVRDNALYIAHGIAQHAPIIVVNPTSQKMDQLRFIMDVPEGLEVVGIEKEMQSPKIAYPANGRVKRVSQQQTDTAEKLKRYVFEFENVKSFKGGADWKQHIHGMVFRLTNGASGPLTVYYRVEGKGNGVSLVEAWNSLTVVPLKSVKARRPAKMPTVLWHGYRTGGYNQSEAKALVKTFADIGFNSYIDRTSEHTPKGKPRPAWLNQLHENDFFIIMEIGITYFAKKVGYKHSSQYAKNFDGKLPFVRIRPEFLLGDARKALFDHVKHVMEFTGAHASIWDLEFDPFRICDTSEFTREKFARFANLKRTPSIDEIKNRYREQWVSYMCDVWSRVAEVYRDGTKAAGQDRQVWLYSSYPGEIYRQKYAIDWALMRDIVDVAAMGYAVPSQRTLHVLNGKAKLNAGVLHFEASIPGQYRSLKTRILRMVAQGANGVSLFNWVVLDGRAYTLISEAFNLMADHERFFLEGKRSKVVTVRTEIPLKDIYLLEHKNEKLLLVFNPSGKVKKAVVNLGKEYRIEDYYTGQVSTSGLLRVEVQPQDVKAYVIRPK